MPDGVTVIHGDCIEVMRNMADGSVDAVMTDPPFSEATHKGARTRTVGANSDPLIDFASLDGETFLDFVREAVRVSRRWVVMFCDWHHAALVEPAGLPLVRLGIWVKPNSAPQLSGDRPAMGWEAIAFLHRPGAKRWNGGGRRAVWECNRVNAPDHPTQKPLWLVSQFVRLFTDPDDLVFDPYAGSGTTGVACLKAGRKCVLIEKDIRYIPIINRRLESAATPLFAGIEEP